MVFSSLPFLFFYLPVVLLIYKLTPLKLRNLFLLLASLFFYGWGEPVYILIMFLSTAVDYTHGMLVERWRSDDRKARLAVASSVFFNLAILVFFKYWDFIAGNVNALTGLNLPIFGIPLPIGISFYTFQTMSYTIDVYRQSAPVQRNVITFGAYVTLFPQLIAGPIIQYKTVAEQLVSRTENLEKFVSGVRRFTVGLAKKVLLANAIGELWDQALASQSLTVAGAWLGLAAYAFQIYFDFSGYSDMAIGLGRMFGFQFLENFQYPYISSSIKEFWRRWHISLSSWFRDYLYIPLGGNRKGKVRTELNKAVVFFCTGLWHGASWNFVLWGLWHGLFIILEDLLPKGGKVRKALGHVTTLLIVLLGFVLFRADTLESAGLMFSQMFTGFAFTLQSDALLRDLLTPLNLATVALGALCSLPLLPWVRYKAQGDGKGALALRVGSYALSAGLYLLCVMNLAGSAFNPFIYFRF